MSSMNAAATEEDGGDDQLLSKLLTPRTREDTIAQIRYKSPALVTGYSIDGEPLRFQTGALSVIAAPTGHGKTTILINFLLDAAERYPDRRHWFFSYEEDAPTVIIKVLNAFCNEDYSLDNKRTIEAYYRDEDDALENSDGFRIARFLPMEQAFWRLLEQGTINIVSADCPAEALMQAIRVVAEDDAGLVAVDYLQLLHLSSRSRFTARYEELKRICMDLKDTAVETGLPIVAAAQFNREVTSPGKMSLQRIADASDIEKSANKVVAMWNGDMKVPPDSDEPKEYTRRRIKQGTLYIEVLKARDEKGGTSNVFPYNGNRGVIGDRLTNASLSKQQTAETVTLNTNTITAKDLR